MSKNFLRFPIEELQTLRIRCKNKRCGATTEFPIARADRVALEFACPVCKEKFRVAGLKEGENPLEDLAAVWAKLIAIKDAAEIEFELPACENVNRYTEQ